VLAQGGDSLGGDSMAKEIHGSGGKNALLRVDLETICIEDLKKLSQVLMMLLNVRLAIR
jgi:hypothetical protein